MDDGTRTTITKQPPKTQGEKKEIFKIRKEMNKTEIKRFIHKINESKPWVLKKINKIDTTLTQLTHTKKEEKT